ncbi:MAG: NAD(P)-binding domain-containing protein [Gammaproteobacteria bacterium]|nr:NAD(P)-binding domain-containing protein [Gammaproteobacteria bacterium]
MRFIIYGAGGIGGSIGARLHLNGEEVILVARGKHFEAIQASGLAFHTPTIHESLPIDVVSHARDIHVQSDDVVILCMKTQHVEGALRDLQMNAPSNTPIVCCQNGVASERMALRRFSRVYGMVVWLPAEHLEPGVVVNFAENRAGNLDAGCYPRGVDETIERVTSAIHAAGFVSRPDPNIMAQKYAKLMVNLTNALDAACVERPDDVIQEMQSEARGCCDAAGIDYADFRGSRARRGDIRGGPVDGFQRHGSSTLQSLMRETGDIEADYLNGEIVQLGRLHGIPTPTNAAVQQIGISLICGEIKPRSLSADTVRELVNQVRSK